MFGTRPTEASSTVLTSYTGGLLFRSSSPQNDQCPSACQSESVGRCHRLSLASFRQDHPRHFLVQGQQLSFWWATRDTRSHTQRSSLQRSKLGACAVGGPSAKTKPRTRSVPLPPHTRTRSRVPTPACSGWRDRSPRTPPRRIATLVTEQQQLLEQASGPPGTAECAADSWKAETSRLEHPGAARRDRLHHRHARVLPIVLAEEGLLAMLRRRFIVLFVSLLFGSSLVSHQSILSSRRAEAARTTAVRPRSFWGCQRGMLSSAERQRPSARKWLFALCCPHACTRAACAQPTSAAYTVPSVFC